MSKRISCGYHCTAKPVSFGRGQSAVHTAAYNARTQLRHELEDRNTKDYAKRRDSALLFEGIFAPEGAPAWARDREQLWNRAEAAERHMNGQPARNMIVAFPHELDQQQREWLAKDFARERFARKGMVADVTIHAPDAHGDARNFHAHILLTMRRIEGEEFARTKERSWNSKAQLAEWRQAWAEKGAKALERAGHSVEAERWRHGHETLARQRAAALARGDMAFAESLEREATIHKGATLSAMTRRGAGMGSDRLGEAQGVEARNEARAEAQAADRELKGLEAEQRAAALAGARALARDGAALARATAEARLAAADRADTESLKTDPAGRAFAEGARDQAQAIRQERKEAAFWQKQEDWQRESAAAPRAVGKGGGGLQVRNAATGALTSLGDFMLDLFGRLGDSAQAAPQDGKGQDGKAVAAFLADPAERKRQQLARLAAQEANRRDREALDNMERDMKAGKALSSADIANLTHAHQEQIRHFGDDGVRRMVEEARRAAERTQGRERERE